VLSVLIEHILLAYKIMYIGYWEVQWIGIVGVFLFFVHTSLVLMWSLERKPHTLDFYIRRAFRIYPLAIFAITAIALFHAPVAGTPSDFFAYRAPGHSAFGFLRSFLMLWWLERNAPVPESVMWSLPYELQMYLMLPVIFFFVARNFSRWPLLLFWAFIVTVCVTTFHGVSHNFFLCIPYFLPGIIAYVGFGRVRALFPAWMLVPFLASIWILFMPRAGWRVADVVCLAVGLGLPYFHQFKVGWIIHPSRILAKYSYGVYLAHPFGIVLGLDLMPRSPLALQLAVIFASTALISFAAYHLLEHPMIRLGSRLANLAELRYEQREIAQYRIPESEVT
jgi:peptidoglycan/LPS O-acetylase OafA/YrhL